MAELLRSGTEGASVDSLLNVTLSNPVAKILGLGDSLALTEAQVLTLGLISDSLDARLEQRRAALRPLLENLTSQAAARGEQGRPGGVAPQALQQIQLEIQPQLEGAQRETREAVASAQRTVTPEQWQTVPAELRNAGETPAGGTRGGFNAVGLIDRMLANPLPVLLALEDTLGLSAEQVAQIETLSKALQGKLDKRREDLGRRFDNAATGQQQGQIFQQIQPDIEATRREVQDALSAVEKILTPDQWKRLPERVRNPFQQGGGRRGG
jgi:hypothetical protein